MGLLFHDISKYYAANIYDNLLVIGHITYRDDRYIFVKSESHQPISLAVDPDADITRLIHIIGEIHPRSSLEDLLAEDISSCLLLIDNDETGEIEVRSIHKGMGAFIFTGQLCPLVLWNPYYEEHGYFDVVDIQNIFAETRLKTSFIAVISESLRNLELFPPLIHLKKV